MTPKAATRSRRGLLGSGGLRLVAAAAFFIAIPTTFASDTQGTVEDGLRQVLDDALAANLELQAGQAGVRQRYAALDQARARYLPVVDFDARYSVANGGRTIEFPVGDLLNPVYETLDDLLVQSGQPPSFPRVRNEEIELLMPTEQNTRVVAAQPIYDPRLGPAVEATRQDVNRAEAGLAGLRTRVVRDTKQAYYEWLAAQQQALVLDATLEVARSNLAANESLYRNGKITRDFVFRAEADQLEVEQQRRAAEARVRIARSYVNLLRNVPLDSPVPGATIDEATVDRFRERLTQRVAGRRVDLPALQETATEQRAEIDGLDAAIAGSVAQQDLARAAFKPMLAVGAEAGIQGEDYGFTDDERYVLASVVLRWNAYRGGADRAALAEARALTEELAAFRIAARKRDLGQINQTEFIDARRTQTDAQLNLNRVRAEFLARLAELEFAIGGTRASAKEWL